MASILKVDKIRGTGLDSDTISLDGSGNITIPKNVTFSGTVSGGAGGYKLLGRSTWSSGVSVVAFADIIDSTITNIVIKGSVRYTDGQNSLTFMYLTTSGGSTAGTGGSGLACYQGEWYNRAASATVNGDVRNGDFQYLRIPDNTNMYGGTIHTFTIEVNDIYAGRTQGTTNLSGTPKHYGGLFHHQAQSTDASDWSGGNGWFKMVNANNDLAAITGVRFNPSNSNYQAGEIAVYGLATS